MSEQEKIVGPSIEQPQSQPSLPEQASLPETKIERAEPATESTVVTQPPATPAEASYTIPLTPEAQRAADIERILEADLKDVYFNLPEDKREEFRVRGEQTAYQINVLLSEAKVKVKKIIDLIRNWLLIIPGVNKFFLEQEAKLKADQILKLNKF